MTSPSDELRREERIARRGDFRAAYERGARVHGRFLTLFVMPTSHASARLGIAASRKIGNAVRRNRAKRLIRELFRQNKPQAILDIVVVPRRELLDAPFANLESDYRATLGRALRSRRG